MKWTISILAAAFTTAWAVVGAQSNSSMNQDKKMDGMAKIGGMDVSYTGCVEAAGPGQFTLAHAVAATSRMAADSMKELQVKKNEMAMNGKKKENMMSTMLTLSSTAVDLSKHVGQKVSVTGSPAPKMAPMDRGAMTKDPAAFIVTSLRTVPGSCS